MGDVMDYTMELYQSGTALWRSDINNWIVVAFRRGMEFNGVGVYPIY
jgi:hypothetical protein